MKRREMKLLLEERFERIALLETRIDTMDQLVEGYRAREQAVLDAMQTAKENAAKALEQVQTQGAQIQAEAQRVLAEAEQTRLGARAEAEALLSDAISAANTLRAEAERKGLEVTATVRADSERMLRDAEIIKREYEEMVDSFNAMLEQNASELEITAARFAEFVKNRKIDRAEARLDGNAFYKSVGELSDAALPDASEDPALLMQNIYRIQNRPLPEDRLESAPAQEPELSMQAEEPKAMPEETAEPLTEVVTQSGSEIPAKETESAISDAPKFPIVDGSGADERKNATEPYSEAAWADEAQESESEPQAEFVKTFDDAFVKSDYTIHDDECSVMQADAERAFDTLMSGGEVLAGTAAATIPIAATLATEKLDAQPMEDAARAFDAYFDETLEQGGKTAQDGSPTEQATEPYSEAAWANEAQESESEPQAEFVKTFDDAFVKSDYTVRTDECSVMQADAERAFDTLISGGETLAGAAAATIPAAATLATEKLDAQPMEDAARAFDAYFDETLEQGGKTAQDGITTEPQGTAPEVALTAEETKEPESDQESISDEKLQELLDTIMSTDSAPAPETGDVPEPYSEKAWSRDSFSSDLEPQAEGALFGEQDVEPKKPVYAYSDDAQLPPVSSDAERAFDDYLANVASFTTPVPAAEPAAPVEAAAPQVPAEPEPYSEKAWSRDSFTSDSEPQAEGALFGEQDVEPKKPVYAYSDDAQLPPVSSDAERAFDDYLANVASFTTPAPAAVPAAPAQAAALTRETENTPEQTASSFDGERAFDDYFAGADAPKQTASAAPASGSTSEWSYEPTFEEAKPQSQTATYDASDEPEEEEEPKPAPRKYNEYGEIREWEPEPEPDMDDIPTVSRVIGQPDRGDDISLDDLLDEIIKAGD